MDLATLALTVIGTVAGVAGAFFAWVPIRHRLTGRRARKAAAQAVPPARPAPVPATPVGPGGTVPGQYDVFVSYTHADDAEVRELAAGLTAHGVRVAIDTMLMGPGKVVVHEVDKAIRDSSHGLVVFSPASLRSAWVMNEYAVLMRRSIEQGRLFVPVLVGDVRDEDLPEFARARFYSDLRSPAADVYEERVRELAEALRGTREP